jgi:hypothetical protein
MALRPGLLLFGPALAWVAAAAIGIAWTSADSRAWSAIDRHGSAVVGASACRECHADAWQSWHASWHRTMTQRPSPGAPLPLELGAAPEVGQMLAPFAGESLDYLGFRATMDRTEAGIPRIRVARSGESDVPGETVLDVEVALSVGSHRYQQYVGVLEGVLWRLPVAWHVGEARWIHMNGAFVEPEGEPGSLADYQRHLGRWNDNCIFCHNTEPVPGLQESGQFASAVGELGIACEACHGPAAAHVERHRNPLRRMLAGRDLGDGSITHPGRLDPGRESAICGRCHGQRIARDISAVMEHGDGFVPGDVLADVSRPIFADSTIGTEPLPFAMRFWPDGTPRLSAYEYQALLLSPCHESGEGLGCNHCHDMHGDDPDGQLRANRSGADACVDCHDLAADHGGHRAVESVDCLDCHMPRITYGLLEGMASHRITSPDPAALVGRHDQPDACTQCHVDRSRRWAAESMAELGLHGSPAGVEDPLELRGSRVLLDLHGGDPIQRNLAAHALAWPDATGSIDQRMTWLAGALEDEYPSVRWFAWRGLRALAESAGRTELVAALARFDYLAPIEARVETLGPIHAQLGPLQASEDLFDDLAEARLETAIWIGE